MVSFFVPFLALFAPFDSAFFFASCCLLSSAPLCAAVEALADEGLDVVLVGVFEELFEELFEGHFTEASRVESCLGLLDADVDVGVTLPIPSMFFKASVASVLAMLSILCDGFLGIFDGKSGEKFC